MNLRIETLKPRPEGKGYEIVALLGHAELRALGGELRGLGVFPTGRLVEEARILSDGEQQFLSSPVSVDGDVKCATIEYREHLYVVYRVPVKKSFGKW